MSVVARGAISPHILCDITDQRPPDVVGLSKMWSAGKLRKIAPSALCNVHWAIARAGRLVATKLRKIAPSALCNVHWAIARAGRLVATLPDSTVERAMKQVAGLRTCAAHVRRPAGGGGVVPVM